MSLQSALQWPTRVRHPRQAFASEGAGHRVEWIDRAHPDRMDVQRFIADIFRRRHGAEIQYFTDVLIGCRDRDGKWAAALGFTPLACRGAFLEQYLDRPVEQVIARHEGPGNPRHPVSRWDIVEVGNLAAIRAGAARSLILLMTRYLHRRHFRWVVFTATRELANSFARLSFAPVAMAPADPRKLNGAANRWGTYYDNRPQVMYGDIDAAHEQLPSAD